MRKTYRDWSEGRSRLQRPTERTGISEQFLREEESRSPGYIDRAFAGGWINEEQKNEAKQPKQ